MALWLHQHLYELETQVYSGCVSVAFRPPKGDFMEQTSKFIWVLKCLDVLPCEPSSVYNIANAQKSF